MNIPQSESIYSNTVLSVFRNANNSDEGTTCTLDAVVKRIRDGNNGLQTKTEKCRKFTKAERDKYRKFKASELPAVTFSGEFDNRKASKLKKHTGLVVLDFDYIDVADVMSQVSEIPSCVFAFISPSGEGVKAIISVDPMPQNDREHKYAFHALKTKFEHIANADKKGSDVSRLCLLCYDPQAYYNPSPQQPFKWTPPPETPAQDKPKSEPTKTDIDLSVLDYIDPDDYENWINIGLAMKNEGLGFDVWDNWSKKSGKYQEGETAKKWDTFKTDSKLDADKITWKSVKSLAKENGYKPKAKSEQSDKPSALTLPEDRFFQKARGFNVRQMIDELTANDDYISYGDDVCRYKNGVYRQDERFNQRVRELLNTRASVSRVNETRAAFQDEFQTDLSDSKHLINFKNGLLDINTLELIPHTPEHKNITQYPVEWKPLEYTITNCGKSKTCKLLTELMNDNSIITLMEAIGSIYHNDSPQMQTGFILTGAGSNGKSTLLKIVEMMIGKENICNTDWGDFETKPYSAHSLVGKSLTLNEDFTNSSKLGGVVKHAVTGGTINARQIYERAFDFIPQATWIMACNDLPHSSDTSYGFYRRWFIISFPNCFEKNQNKGNQVIRDCTEKNEQQTFTALCIQAYQKAWQRGCYTEPTCHQENMAMYKSVSSPILAWISENTKQDDNAKPEKRKAFFDDYFVWCELNNQKAMSAQRFYAELKNHSWVIDAQNNRYGAEVMKAVKGQILV